MQSRAEHASSSLGPFKQTDCWLTISLANLTNVQDYLTE